MAVKDYSTNPDENIAISGINIGEGCAPSRTVRAAIKKAPVHAGAFVLNKKIPQRRSEGEQW